MPNIDRQAYLHILTKTKPSKRKNQEGILQLQILKYLKAIGTTAGKTKTVGIKRGKVFCLDPYTFLGFPDITGFWKNEIFFCECKAPKGIQSDYQKTFQKLCNEANIKYILAYDLTDVTNVIS